MTFNVGKGVNQSNRDSLISQYRTRPVLEIMNIVDALVPQSPAAQPGASRKRKQTDLSTEGEIETVEDTKPARKALLAARLKELEVSVDESYSRVDLQRQVRRLTALPRAEDPVDVVDLTGDE